MYYTTNIAQPLIIAFVITGLGTGGAEMMLYKLLTKIDKQRFKPIVISLMDRGTFGERIEKLGIAVYTLDMKRGMPTPATFWRLINIINQVKPDILQGWMYHGNLAAYLASIFSSSKIPVVWSIHHSIQSLELEKRMTIAIIKLCANISRFVERIIFVSKNSKAQHSAIGYTSANSCVIPNGFDTSLFQPSSSAKISIRQELGLSENTFLIGLIGRYHPMKDHDNFLQAALLLSKNFPQIHFLLAGTGTDTSNDKLRDSIEKLELSNRVHLLGERSNTYWLIAGLDILTLSSAYGEAFPLVVGEAMACGVPSVVTDIGDSGWIVGDTGKVIPPRNPQSLMKAWQDLIDIGREGREALGKAARSRIINHFSLHYIVNKYEKLYDELLIKNRIKHVI